MAHPYQPRNIRNTHTVTPPLILSAHPPGEQTGGQRSHPWGDLGTFSNDSSKSELPSSDCSEGSSLPHEEPPQEQVPPSSKILDTSLNFLVGHDGTQVMVQYPQPSPPALAADGSVTIHKALFWRLMDRDQSAVLELQVLAVPDLQNSSPLVQYAHVPGIHLGSAGIRNDNLQVFSKQVRRRSPTANLALDRGQFWRRTPKP